MAEDQSIFEQFPNQWDEYNWKGMPKFEHKNLAPKRTMLVHFASDADVEAFSKLVGQKFNAKTKFMWYPQAAKHNMADKVYDTKAETRIDPRYPVYVISKGRWESRLTIKALEKIGVPYHVVVEPQEYEHYARIVDPAKIYILPFSNLGQGSIPARNWVWEHSLSIGAARHWILDDNIRHFFYYKDNSIIQISDGITFAAIENYVDQYENIALAGMQYYMFVVRKKGNYTPIDLNTRIYSCILINNSLPFDKYKWRGRYNEDTDLSIRVMKDGYCTALFYAFLAEKMPTLTMKGGNTEELYKDDGRLLMAQSLQEQHPDIVRVTEKWGRYQHHVNYKQFKFNRLKLKPDATTPQLDDLLTLRHLDASAITEWQGQTDEEEQQESPPAARILLPDEQVISPVQPVVINFKPSSEQASSILETEPSPPATGIALPKQVTMPMQPVVIGSPTVRRHEPVTIPNFYSVVPKSEWVDPFLAVHAEILKAADDHPLKFNESTWNHDAHDAVGVDVEVFKNFFCVCFLRFSDNKRLIFEQSERTSFDADLLREILDENLTISFNGLTYDLPVICLALNGATNEELKSASDLIIKGDMRPWDVARQLGVRIPSWDHIDLMEPNPSVRMGLKTLNGRLHGKHMVDLPYDPDTVLTPKQMNVVTIYCGHSDLDATRLLYDALKEPLALRIALGERYGIDLRSKSDAQIGELIVTRRVEELTRKRVQKLNQQPDVFRYNPPDFLSYEGEVLQSLLNELREMTFHAPGGKVELPAGLSGRQIQIGGMAYKMGIGGLHSTESCRTLCSDDERVLIDADVTGYYPRIIIKLGLYPPALGPVFCKVYTSIVEEREAAKEQIKSLSRDDPEYEPTKVKIEGLKIVNNGVFGKLGSTYGALSSPPAYIAVTLTGQLSELMLIERAENAGISVVSANTDGLVFHCPRASLGILDTIVTKWESQTGFNLERTEYRALYSRDVNTYLAVKPDGKTKRKGPIADPWSENDLRGQMSKNPQMSILSEAVVRYVVDGKPLEETVRSCGDARMFLTVIRAAGGATWREAALGRVVRYYWSTDGDPIIAGGTRRVAKTDGAKPLQELTGEMPKDIDFRRYISEAEKLAGELGINVGGVL